MATFRDVDQNIVEVTCTANRVHDYVVDFDRTQGNVINVYSLIQRAGSKSYLRLLYNYASKNSHKLTAWCAINAARAALKNSDNEEYRRIGERHGY